MKFVKGNWIEMRVKPVHEGQYELKSSQGEPMSAGFLSQKWDTETAGFTHWRGQHLKGMKKTRARRRVFDAYRTTKDDTHAPALENALFLARRAVSSGFGYDAYRFYLIANAIDPASLAEVDHQWIQRFRKHPSRAKDQIEAVQYKADKFFDKRGGQPVRGNATSP